METAGVLLTAARIRQRYPYTDTDVKAYLHSIRQAALIVADLPPLSGLVRDPNDDMVLACAVAAEAAYVVTRDDDLLSLGVMKEWPLLPRKLSSPCCEAHGDEGSA